MEGCFHGAFFDGERESVCGVNFGQFMVLLRPTAAVDGNEGEGVGAGAPTADGTGDGCMAWYQTCYSDSVRVLLFLHMLREYLTYEI